MGKRRVDGRRERESKREKGRNMRILIAINQARVLYDFKRELVEALY